MTTVRCPTCDAKYNVDPAKLGDGGRKLKCAKCQTVWLATVEFVEEAVPVEVPVVVAADVPEEPKPVEERDEPEGDGEAEASPDGDAAFAPDSDDMLVQRNPGLESVVSVGGWRQLLRGENVWRTAAVGFLVLGLLTGSFVLWNKVLRGGAHEAVEVKEEHPVAAHEEGPKVAMLADVVKPPEGIVLHRVRGEVSEVEGNNGGMALTVRGLLANNTSQTITVPPLRLELLGKDGNVADMWPVSGVAARMEGGTEEAWTVSLTAPDMTTIAGWRVVFVAE